MYNVYSAAHIRPMSIHVVNTGLLACPFGMAPSPLMVLPINREMSSKMPGGNIMDHIPFMNIMPFAMCTSPANPMVIALTAAALGVPTPAPCIPATVAPWIPGSPTVLLGNMPALNNTCMCMCLWAGVIQVTAPGQFTVMVA